ncbi:MAG: cytochrome c [Amylibacter sp.]|nr:cytochrome c [Amylibacter sp.]
MRNIIIVTIITLLGAAWYFTQEKPSNQTAQNTTSIIVPELTAAAQIGETYFNAKCAACHGINGAGTQKGPTFINKAYRKGHHADESFQRAAKLGVAAHHWRFGNMPPVAGITRAEVTKIIVYIREIQAANGL